MTRHSGLLWGGHWVRQQFLHNGGWWQLAGDRACSQVWPASGGGGGELATMIHVSLVSYGRLSWDFVCVNVSELLYSSNSKALWSQHRQLYKGAGLLFPYMYWERSPAPCPSLYSCLWIPVLSSSQIRGNSMYFWYLMFDLTNDGNTYVKGRKGRAYFFKCNFNGCLF